MNNSEPTLIDGHPFVPYQEEPLDAKDAAQRLHGFRKLMDGRRTIRMFDPNRPVSRETIEEILHIAGSAPSGAHKQPWTFVAISDLATKQAIREAAEEQERRFYSEVAPETWLADLAPLGTDWHKHHLTDAPWVIVLFAQDYAVGPKGEKLKHYYVQESVGIAAGFFLTAVRQAGLCSLTHTPSPMNFLRDLLGRPKNERAYLVLPVGYPAADCLVPDIRRKDLDQFVNWWE